MSARRLSVARLAATFAIAISLSSALNGCGPSRLEKDEALINELEEELDREQADGSSE
ncbi:MAG: hypothetical protein AAGH38_11055 [Pseudomonadota bacterium]